MKSMFCSVQASAGFSWLIIRQSHLIFRSENYIVIYKYPTEVVCWQISSLLVVKNTCLFPGHKLISNSRQQKISIFSNSPTSLGIQNDPSKNFVAKVPFFILLTFFYVGIWTIYVTKMLYIIQVNLFQKHLFLPQLTHNMTKGCSLNHQFSSWKFQAQNMLCT